MDLAVGEGKHKVRRKDVAGEVVGSVTVVGGTWEW